MYKTTPVKKCSFSGCSNNSENCPKLAFHNFPKNHLKEWLDVCENQVLRTKSDINLRRNCYVCSNHFKREDYPQILSPFQGKLKAGAIPFREKESRAEPSNSSISLNLASNNESICNLLNQNKSSLFNPGSASNSYSYDMNETAGPSSKDLINTTTESLIHINDYSTTSTLNDISFKEETTGSSNNDGFCIIHENDLPANNPHMKNIETQTDDYESYVCYEEPSFSLFCCTFHSDNDAETFCNLKSEDIKLPSTYIINKFGDSTICKKHGRPKQQQYPKNLLSKKKKFLKRDQNKKVELYEVKMPDMHSQSNIVIEVSENADDSTTFQSDIINDGMDELEEDNLLESENESKLKRNKKNFLFNKKMKKHFPKDLCIKCTSKPNKFRCRRIAHHLDNEFGCKFCNYTFNNLDLLENHILVQHSEKVQYFECSICKKNFNFNELRYYHHISNHECKICGQTYYCKTELINHYKDKHYEQTQSHGSCPVCQRTFSNVDFYVAHTKPTKCIKCNEVFNCIRMRRSHTARKHPNYRCKLCLRRFQTQARLDLHMQHPHCNKERKFKCPVCFKGFFTKNVLEEHTRIHTGERPLLCDTCGATFHHRGALYMHIHCVHGVYKKVINQDGIEEVRLIKKGRKKKSLVQPEHNQY